MNVTTRSEILRRAQLWRCPDTQYWQKAEIVPELTEGGAHVWLCPLTDVKSLSSLMSAVEIERAQNFLPESKSVEFALARGWLRVLLSCYVRETEPQSIRLGIADAGKPFAVDYSSLYFNLSHSGDLVAIAFSHQEVGIDIEKIKPLPDWRALAEGMLIYETFSEIAEAAEQLQSEMFLRHFTAREAHLKAVGTGFSENPRNETVATGKTQGSVTASPLPEVPGYVGHLCLRSLMSVTIASVPR